MALAHLAFACATCNLVRMAATGRPSPGSGPTRELASGWGLGSARPNGPISSPGCAYTYFFGTTCRTLDRPVPNLLCAVTMSLQEIPEKRPENLWYLAAGPSRATFVWPSAVARTT